MTPPNSGLRPTASRLRSGSSASSNTPPQRRQLNQADSRSESVQQVVSSSSQQKSSTATNQPTIMTRSRFGFPAPTAASSSDAPVTADQKENVRPGPGEARLAKTTRTSSISASQIARPGSALGRPGSALGRPASALGRPATALGTRSANASVQSGAGGLGVSRIPAKAGRKRRSSSVSSQAPPLPGLQSTHDAPQASKPVGPARAASEFQEPSKPSRESSEELRRAQEECRVWKARFEETQDRLSALEGAQDAQLDRVRDDQRRLEEDYCERIEQMERAFEADLRRASDQTAALETANAQHASDLEQRASEMEALQQEMTQMDGELGRSASQLMELSSTKDALESQLDASRAELTRLAADNQRRVDQVTEHYHTIQAKLHLDLDQISAEYQSLLQQSFAAGAAFGPASAATTTESRPDYVREAHKLGEQVQSLERLVESYEEEKQGWEAERKRLQEAVHDAHSKALSNDRFEPHHLFHDQSLIQFNVSTSMSKHNNTSDEEQKDGHGFSDAIADEEELPLIDITLTPDVDDDDGFEQKPAWGTHGRSTLDKSAERIFQADRARPVNEPGAGRQSLGGQKMSSAEEASDDKESVIAGLSAKIAALETLVAQLRSAAASHAEAQTADADALAEARADLARVEAQAADERERSAQTEHGRVDELEAVRAQMGAAAEAFATREAGLEAAMEEMRMTLVEADVHERVLLQLAGCEAEIEKLKRELDGVQETKRAMESASKVELSGLEAKISEIKQETSVMVARLVEEHEQAICQLKAQSEDTWTTERGVLQEQLNDARVELETRTASLNGVIEDLKNEAGGHEALLNRVAAFEADVARLKGELEDAQESAHVLESSHQQELSALEEQISNIKQESSSTVARLVEDHEQVVRQLKSQSEHDRATDREGLEHQLDEARVELEARTASLNGVIEDLKSTMMGESGCHEAVLKQVAEYEEQLARVKRELESAQENGRVLESSYQQQFSALQTQISAIKQESSDMVTRLVEEHEQVLRQLKSQSEHDRATDREGLERQLDEARVELEARTGRLNGVIEDMKRTMMGEAGGHEAVLKQLADYEEELERVKQELESAQESGRVLESSYQQQLSALQTQISVIKHESSDMVTRLVEQHEQMVLQLKSQSEHDRATDREGLEHQLDKARVELEARTGRLNAVIEDMKSTMMGEAGGHEAVLKQVAEYEEELARVKRELESARESGRALESSNQQEVSALQTRLNATRDEATEEAERVSEDHKQTVQNFEDEVKRLKSELDAVQMTYKKATDKLEELAGIDPQQIEILTCRLRQERDQGRCAIRFMNLERQAIEETSRTAIAELLEKQQHLEAAASEERNVLVVALSTLYQTLKAADRARHVAKGVGHGGAESCGHALGAFVGGSGAEMECSESVPRFENNASESNNSPRLASGAYAEALEQIASLTEQIEDLKEQVLCAHVTHQEQERLGLLDLDNLRHELATSHEQHMQHDAQQTRKISNLELSLASIQHQFQSLEVCFKALQSDNTELNERLSEERGKYSQSQEANEALKTEIRRLQDDFLKMTADAMTHEERVRCLEGHLSVAQDSAELALQKQTSDLAAQVAQLTLDVEQQKDLVSNLGSLLEEANSAQEKHLATIAGFEELIKTQELSRRGEMDSLQHELEDCCETIGKLQQVQAELTAQKEAFQAQVLDLTSELEGRAAAIVELEEAKVALLEESQEADRVHQRAQAELEVKLSHALERQAETAERRQSLAEQLEELRHTIQALESEKQVLIDTLGSKLEDQQLSKDGIVQELTSIKQELLEATASRESTIQELSDSKQEIRRLTQELEGLGLLQSGHEELSQEYQALVNAFEVLQGEARVLTEELDALRSQSDAGANSIAGLKAELIEKDDMIKSLKADLATVSKLHRNLPSPDLAERMKELEGRVEAKSNEVEEAMDRLLDEMQKNKRLTTMVETLKIRLKTKAKSAIAEEQPERSSSDPCAGSSANEPEGRLTVSSARKRKHETSVSSGETKSRVDLANADKENAESNGRQPIRRKISVADQKPSRADGCEQTKTGAHQAGVEGALQVLSPNQPQQSDKPRRAVRSRSGSEHKPASQTNATLLANIQSLRRKQQQQGTSSQPSTGRQRTTVTRPSRKASDCSQ